MFLENSGFSAKSTFSKHADEITKNYKFRLQDKQLQEMSDHGMCLSMHQVNQSNQRRKNSIFKDLLIFLSNWKY